jgi:putative ABC transport system permease protein
MRWWCKRADEDFAEEIRTNLALETDRLIAAGMRPEEARSAALRAFGNVTRARERFYEGGRTLWLDQARQDVAYAFRTFVRERGFALVVVLTLALGIGANTAVFSLVNSLLLRPLPVRHPEQLVVMADPSRSLSPFMWNYAMWAQIRQRPHLFDGAFGYSYSRFNLASGGETEFVDGLYASGTFFETLGVNAILGRTFTDADDQSGGGRAGPIAVISDGFWRRRFGGAADILDRPLYVDRVRFAILGVLPPGFIGPVSGRALDIVIPIGTVSLIRGPQFLDQPGANWITIMARLKPGQTLEAARAAVRSVQPQLRDASLPPRSQNPDAYLRNPLTLLPAGVGNPLAPPRVRAERPLLAMQLAVALVLLIACANIANFMLARGVARKHEISVRLALGASRWRLLRQLSVEGLLLASVGAMCGFLLAQWGTRLLVRLFSTGPYAMALDLAPDARVLAFTAGVTIMASVLFALIPANRATHVEPIESLKEQPLRLVGTRLRLASGFVIAQVALSLVLVVSGGLLIQTYSNLATRDLGFDPSRMLIIDLEALKADIPPAKRLVVFEEVRRAVAAVPGVAGAAIADVTPVTGATMVGDVEVSGMPVPRGRGETFVNRVSPGWLSLYQTPVVSGRDVQDADSSSARQVAIVNQAFARKFLSGVDPLGRIVRQLEGPPGHAPRAWEIVGVTSDAVYESLRAPVPPTMYLAFNQIDEDALAAGAAPPSASLSVRATTVPPTTLTHSIAAAIANVNPSLDLTFRSLPDVVAGSITLERTLAILSGCFGALSLLLAVVGIYGLTSYAVGRRRKEIGIRIALGAKSSLVVRRVVSRMMMLVGVGMVLGAGTILWASQFMEALLFNLEPRDSFTFIGAIVLLLAVGALAAWLPARRATKVDPLVALRCE